jgi:ABC-type Mn2+/Zn2+ transport system permease subunit
MLFFPFKIFLTASVGAALAGVACGLIGSFVIRMNLASVGFTMSHAAFAGAALGLLLPINPLICAIAFSILVAALLGPATEKAKLPVNIIMGITFPLTMALALIFLRYAPETAMSSNAMSLLWGSILGMTNTDVAKLAALTLFMILVITLFFKEFEALTFDRKLARSSGINTKPFFYTILFLTGITVSLSLKLVGGLLVFALIINPASAAYQLFYDMKKILLLSPVLGGLFAIAGILLSFYLNLPVGASIALASTIGFALAVGISPKRRRG